MTVCAGSSMLLPTLEKFVFIKYGLDPNTPGLNQKILEYFITEGHLDKHLEESKKYWQLNFKRCFPYF